MFDLPQDPDVGLVAVTDVVKPDRLIEDAEMGLGEVGIGDDEL
jgi:hypothetical protein